MVGEKKEWGFAVNTLLLNRTSVWFTLRRFTITESIQSLAVRISKLYFGRVVVNVWEEGNHIFHVQRHHYK